MTRFYGLNVQAAQIADKQRLLTYMRVAQPPWNVVLDGVGLAREMKAASPKSNIAVRAGFPDGYWINTVKEPSKCLDYWRKELNGADLWVYVDNEAGIAPEWHLELIKQNKANPLKLLILNTSVGTPEPEDWRKQKVIDLLRACDIYREWVAIGTHGGYFNVVPTSGFIGGYPDNAGAEPNLDSKPGETGRNLIPVANWPPKDEVDRLSKFFAGRDMFMFQTCDWAGIKHPRVVLTEAGQDDVSVIKPWVERHVGQGIRGFQTVLPYWQRTYPQWKPEETYANMLIYLADSVYSNMPAIEGACIYCYGNNGDPTWQQFNIEGHDEVLTRLEQYANTTPEPPMPLPSRPKPSNANDKHRMKATQNVELLAGDGTGYGLKGVIHPDVEVDIYNTPQSFDRFGLAYYKWAEVRTGDLYGYGGWVKADAGWQEVKKATAEVPPAPKPETETTEAPVVVDPPPLEPIKRYQIVIELPPQLAAFAQYFDQIKWKVVEVI